MVFHETATTRIGYELTANREIKIIEAKQILNIGSYSSLEGDLINTYVKTLFQLNFLHHFNIAPSIKLLDTW